MARLWFKAKNYGYGWYPSTAQGWAVTVGYVVLLLLPIPLLTLIGFDRISGSLFTVIFLPWTFFLTFGLLWICVAKGEKARWRWGGKKSS